MEYLPPNKNDLSRYPHGPLWLPGPRMNMFEPSKNERWVKNLVAKTSNVFGSTVLHFDHK